jgi:hypothetical protein
MLEMVALMAILVQWWYSTGSRDGGGGGGVDGNVIQCQW